MELVGLPIEERQMILDLLGKVRQRMLTPEKIRHYDEMEEFPEAVIRELLGPNIGLQLLFIPEEFGGMGGGARDIAVVSEEMAKICLGIATAFLAIHLGTDPILVGATDEQKKKWLARIAEEGAIVAYAVTEPEAGSNLSNFKTTAVPEHDSAGVLIGYRIQGNKQFISNGGFADFLTVLAQTPEGPSFFIIEKNTQGFNPGKPEKKHGIRCSNTSPLTFDNVFIPIENLVGGIPGRGMAQANEVFGYTRLMVAAFGLGAGVAALSKVIPYARQRVQFGSPLLEKQGYTHKLIVPHVVRLEAARAYIEYVAERLDGGEKGLEVEGSIAKLFATEAGNRCADDAIQALGGYGFIQEYDVEKIKRDVKITTIYEGTSEIQQMIISTFRWRSTVKTKGQFYKDIAHEMDRVHESIADCGAASMAQIIRLLNELITAVHQAKLTRQQHIMFLLADLMTAAEAGAALVRKLSRIDKNHEAQMDHLKICGRINSAFAAQIAHLTAHQIIIGSGNWSAQDLMEIFNTSGFNFQATQAGLIADMDAIAGKL